MRFLWASEAVWLVASERAPPRIAENPLPLATEQDAIAAGAGATGEGLGLPAKIEYLPPLEPPSAG